jgi:REP element-mobilizing transposase RayT
MIGQFKSIVAKRINALRVTPGCPVWQRNFYEHVIRDETDLQAIREYIVNNPLQWELDENNPAKMNR